MVEAVKRPFWLHQIAEYVIGAALVGSGMQSPSPMVPSVLGGIVILNAACVDAPLGAFRLLGRRAHRVADLVLVVLGMVATAAPGLDMGTRIVQGCCIVVLAIVVRNTNYSAVPKTRSVVPKSDTSDAPSRGSLRSEEFGRNAGRVAGTLAGRARAKWQAGREPDSPSR